MLQWLEFNGRKKYMGQIYVRSTKDSFSIHVINVIERSNIVKPRLLTIIMITIVNNYKRILLRFVTFGCIQN